MSNPAVRILGCVTDLYGATVRVGVDHGSVTVDGPPSWALDLEAQGQFAQLYVAASREAMAWTEAARREAREEALDAALEAAGRLDRAAMPGQAGADAYGPHECSFPCNPPGGTFWSPGPCTTCGKPYAVAQAESQLAEAQAALAEAHGQVSADDRS